jgi:hypothetical protein
MEVVERLEPIPMRPLNQVDAVGEICRDLPFGRTNLCCG